MLAVLYCSLKSETEFQPRCAACSLRRESKKKIWSDRDLTIKSSNDFLMCKAGSWLSSGFYKFETRPPVYSRELNICSNLYLDRSKDRVKDLLTLPFLFFKIYISLNGVYPCGSLYKYDTFFYGLFTCQVSFDEFLSPNQKIKEDINTVINSWELFISKVFAPETIADMWPRVLHIDFGKVYYPTEWWSICRSDVHLNCWLSLQYAFQLDAESH